MSYDDSYDDVDFDRPGWGAAVLRFFGGSAVLPITFCIVMYFWAGRMGVEKTLTIFAQPDGLMWCLLSGIVLVSWRRCDRLVFTLLIVAWLLYTIAGNSLVVQQAVAGQESPFLSNSPYDVDEPFEYIVVLGGGTSYAPNQTAQLNSSGDRIMVAARLYLTGRAKHIVCTGANISELTDTEIPSPAELGKQILLDLQVPERDITLVEGRNTREEMVQLKALFGDGSPRVGLITSAWHLPRALRLASEQGLEFWAVPADFKSSAASFTPLALIPATENLSALGQIVKEWLARAVGR